VTDKTSTECTVKTRTQILDACSVVDCWPITVGVKTEISFTYRSCKMVHLFCARLHAPNALWKLGLKFFGKWQKSR